MSQVRKPSPLEASVLTPESGGQERAELEARPVVLSAAQVGDGLRAGVGLASCDPFLLHSAL